MVRKERETDRFHIFKQKIYIYYWLINSLTAQYKILTEWHFEQPFKAYESVIKFYLYLIKLSLFDYILFMLDKILYIWLNFIYIIPEASELSLHLY